MTDFFSLTLLLLFLCLAGRLVAGRISRRLKYALWLVIPGYLLVYRLTEPQSLADILTAASPNVAHHWMRLEVEAAGWLNAVRAMLLEGLTVRGIGVRAEFFILLRFVRYGVTAVLLSVFALYNAGFAVRCIKRRRFYKTDARTGMKIYVLDYPQTPFLLGRSVYVHPEMTRNEVFLKHAVCHEYAHYRQGDFIWVLLQFLFLIYYWFHPAVWLAVIRMRQDSELSCDERVISMIGEAERKAYGESLITLLKNRQKKAASGIILMMGGKAKRLKERIGAIAERQKRSVLVTGIVVFGLVLTAGFILYALHNAGRKEEAAAVFLWDGTGVEREEIDKATLYRIVENVSYPPVDVTEEILGEQEILLAEPGRYMIIVTTKDSRRIDISDRGSGENEDGKGLLPSRVIDLGGDNE